MNPLHLPQQDLAQLHLLESAVGGVSLLEFVPQISPLWMVPWHLYPIADLIARAEYEPIRACVSVPPRHGKTELLIHAMLWWLARHPDQYIAYVSYAADLAYDKSRRTMELAPSAGLVLKKRGKKVSHWRTMAGGGLLATGVGGLLTGHGANIMLIDDPVKNREDAESATRRERNWTWFTSTAMTRVEPGGSVIVVHTRWHEDDLIGRLQKQQGDDWEYINLPALSETGELVESDSTDELPYFDESGRIQDPQAAQAALDAAKRMGGYEAAVELQALWPARWSAPSLTTRRREVGEYDWWALFMGQPRPKGGRLFKDATFYDWPVFDDGRILIACDPAATANTRADHSAIVVGVARREKISRLLRVDILEVHRIQVEVPELVAYLDAVQRKWNAPVAVEAVAGFKAVPQSLRQINPKLRIISLNAVGDKFTRALPLVAAWNDGRVRVPSKPTKWMAPFLQELGSFTGVADAEDDQVDGLSHLYNTFDKLVP